MAKTATKTDGTIEQTFEKWEALKELGLPTEKVTLHSAIAVFHNTQSTVSQTKYPGIKMWWCPTGLLCEWRGKRELIPAAGVSLVVPL
jgi:hypothetical protein